MIHVEGPNHMGLNDSRSTNRVRMWNTWNVSTTETVSHMLEWVAQVARESPSGKLQSVIFRCHGGPAYLQMGAGLDRSHTSLFSAWRGLVDKIWISACLVGHIGPASGSPSCAPAGPAAEDGNMFCSEIARAAQCYVVAPTELQVIGRNRTLPYGCLDTYEGLLLSYGPSGNLTWQRRYPSTYEHWYGGWSKNSD